MNFATSQFLVFFAAVFGVILCGALLGILTFWRDTEAAFIYFRF